MKEGASAIEVSEKTARQVREQIQAAQAAAAQLEAFLYGLRAGMDVPDGWQFDARLMAWVAPSAPPEQGQETIAKEATNVAP